MARRLRWLPIMALICALSGCGGGAASQPAACAPRTGGTSLAAARALLNAYVRDIAAHRYDAAEAKIEPCNEAQFGALHRLWKFMAGIPTGDVQVRTHMTPGSPWPGSARGRVTIYVRFGATPFTSWITAATRTFRVDSRPGGWRLTSDVTAKQRGKLSAYGFASYRRPIALSGRRATVVYSAGSDERDARLILRIADSVVGQLWERFGGGRAARRPILFLVQNKQQGERLAHVNLGKVRTPAGFQYSSYAYVDLPEWETYPPASKRSLVVHELTHVASRAWVDHAPHSLAEGVAMYEEDRWRREHHLGAVPLLGLGRLYRAGFPSTAIWSRRETDWGLRNLAAIQYSYLDAMTMVQQIVAHHGGVPALRRLGQAFARRAHGRRDFTTADLNQAFEAALGVSFSTVVAEAHTAAVAR